MDPTQIPLRDLHLPEAIGWWPLAPGWWFLIALAFGAVCYLLYRVYRTWRRNVYRRIALKELARIRSEYRKGADAVTLATDLSELLRRTMLAYAPRGQVAGLTGDAWLEWLDDGLEDRPFSNGAGRNVESLPYRRRDGLAEDIDVDGLIRAVSARLKNPLPAETG